MKKLFVMSLALAFTFSACGLFDPIPTPGKGWVYVQAKDFKTIKSKLDPSKDSIKDGKVQLVEPNVPNKPLCLTNPDAGLGGSWKGLESEAFVIPPFTFLQGPLMVPTSNKVFIESTLPNWEPVNCYLFNNATLTWELVSTFGLNWIRVGNEGKYVLDNGVGDNIFEITWKPNSTLKVTFPPTVEFPLLVSKYSGTITVTNLYGAALSGFEYLITVRGYGYYFFTPATPIGDFWTGFKVKFE